MGEAMYRAQSEAQGASGPSSQGAPGAGQGAGGAAGGQPGDGSKVVDAEFEDVDHNKKNQG